MTDNLTPFTASENLCIAILKGFFFEIICFEKHSTSYTYKITAKDRRR